ncbi:MAG: EAL domain-containing protein [Elusimicrobiota bacterium]
MTDSSSEKQSSVLLIIEDAPLTSLVSQGLEREGFQIQVASTARQAFIEVFKSPPDVILLDINLPDLDGFHVAKELKRNMMLRHIPLVVLSSRIDFLDKMRSLDIIVDEYVVKPINIDDLVLRTKLLLERALVNLDANPLTRLPGNQAIVKAIKSHIGRDKPYAVGYADLNNFKAYNDKYGFSNGDQVILFTADVILQSLQKYSADDYFLGHVGGDDFVFICNYEKANQVCQTITETFDKEAPRFYSAEDKQNRFIVVEDRRGIISQFPLTSVAIGMVSDEGKKFDNLGQINHSLTQLKKYAKSFQGSAFVRDRRSLAAQLAEFTWGPGSSEGTSKALENITTVISQFLPHQLEDIIIQEKISVLFQPILDMRQDEVVAHEALIRGPAGSPLEFPDAIFQTARSTGMVPRLDLVCVRKIIQAAQEINPGIKLFVNIFPETLLGDKILLKALSLNAAEKNLKIIFELSGTHRSNDLSELFDILGKMKLQEQKICLDAGYLNLSGTINYLQDLKPDYMKLDMTQYRDMNDDFDKQKKFFEVVSTIKQMGSEIICTKLESRSDSFLALKAGVSLGQGFLFALPSQLKPS